MPNTTKKKRKYRRMNAEYWGKKSGKAPLSTEYKIPVKVTGQSLPSMTQMLSAIESVVGKPFTKSELVRIGMALNK